MAIERKKFDPSLFNESKAPPFPGNTAGTISNVACYGEFVYKPRGGFQPSIQQKAFFDEIENGSGNIILRAVAGAGKTTTLVEALRLMNGDVFFGAYNKKIANEIKIKAAKARVDRLGIYIATMHGAGLRTWSRNYPRTRVNDRKCAEILEQFALEVAGSRPQIEAASSFILKMISFGKQFLIGINQDWDNLGIWLKLVEHFSADQDLPDSIPINQALIWAIEVFKRSAKRCSETIDFDDMIYAPLFYKCSFWKQDWVLLDEAQDINPARREMAQRMLKPGSGRLIAVGDECQAIYGFTGAGGNSLALIEQQFKCKIMPLTVTYRCAKNIVLYVNQWVSHIQAHPNAINGIVRSPAYNPDLKPIEGKPQPWFLHERPSNNAAILCRYTKPLIQTAYGMLRHSIPCKIEGRDIGNGLIKLAQRWRLSRLDALEGRLTEYLTYEIRKAQLAKSERREQEVIDRVETLRIFIERCRQRHASTINDLIEEIKSIFADDVADIITLSTGHKAKGREWPQVYWIVCADRGRPRKDWEAVEEINIKYVIGTRALNELILVPEPPKENNHG